MLSQKPQVTSAPSIVHRGFGDDLTEELGNVWSMVQGNFADTTASTTTPALPVTTSAVTTTVHTSSGSGSSSSVTAGAPLQTAAVGVGALFGGLAVLANI